MLDSLLLNPSKRENNPWVPKNLRELNGLIIKSIKAISDRALKDKESTSQTCCGNTILLTAALFHCQVIVTGFYVLINSFLV